MAKKTKKQSEYTASLGEALSKFNLKVLDQWLKKHNPTLYRSFSKANEEVRMGAMCKMICNRTDLFNTEARKKAIEWLKEHNMRGGIY